MVVSNRLVWIRDQICRGASCLISVSAAAERQRAKAKIVLRHREPATDNVARTILLSTFDAVANQARHHIVVDRGHKHDSTGASEVSIWFSALPTLAHREWDTGGPPGGDDGPPDDRDDRRRGRSPPSPSWEDPWHGPNGDPWSGAVTRSSLHQRSPPRKQPRQKENRVSVWDNWLPNVVDSSSVTPDPPWTRPARRSRLRARLRSTGTPPLVVSENQDGMFVATGVIEFPDIHPEETDRRVQAPALFDDSFGIWSLLKSSAAAASSVMGATLDAIPETVVADTEGDSLVNSRIATRDATDDLMAQARQYDRLAPQEDHHVFETGHVVYMEDNPFPHYIVRIGHTNYRNELRVRRWDEPENFEAGFWRHYSQLIWLQPGDVVIPGSSITVATEDMFVIPSGSRCIFQHFDGDGDVIINVAGSLRRRTVFKDDFLHFNLC